jgi:hypothetical protein
MMALRGGHGPVKPLKRHVALFFTAIGCVKHARHRTGFMMNFALSQILSFLGS